MSLQFKSVERSALGKAAWNAFADASDDAWLWHRWELLGALETWPGSSDRSFAIIDPERHGRLLGVCPVRRVSRRVGGIMKLSVLESLGGPAIANTLGDKQRGVVLAAICSRLAAEANQGACLETRMMLPPMSPALRGERCPRISPLVSLGMDNQLTQTWVVDLRPGADAVWKGLEGRVRTAVRKAEKSGVVAREAKAGDLDRYYRLHLSTYRRTGATPHPRSYFASIWKDFLGTGLCRVWFAEIGGEVVAAANFGLYKKAGIYWTGASSERGLEVEAGTLLQWAGMQWMMSNGYEWLETGEAFPGAREGKLKGLNDFKRGFGGSLYPYYKGRYRGDGLAAWLMRALRD